MSAPAIPMAEDTGAGAPLRRGLVLGTCTAVTFLYAMTVTIANVSLPQMQGALSASPDQIAWVVTANIVATAVMTPLAGWLTSRFGRRLLCNACVFGFGLATIAFGLSRSFVSISMTVVKTPCPKVACSCGWTPKGLPNFAGALAEKSIGFRE